MSKLPHSALDQYVQNGEEHFQSQSRDLANHMRAAFRIAQAPPLPNPDMVGQLDENSVEWLWEIISFIGFKWQIAPQATLTRPWFEQFINLKTNQEPSYFVVYKQAIDLFIPLVEKYSLTGALDYFYSPASESPIPNWDVVSTWVTQEFLNLYVSQGAYKTYGWWLYPGDAGGPFSDPQHLPYRALTNG